MIPELIDLGIYIVREHMKLMLRFINFTEVSKTLTELILRSFIQMTCYNGKHAGAICWMPASKLP